MNGPFTILAQGGHSFGLLKFLPSHHNPILMAVFVFHSIAHRRCNVHNPLYLRFPFTVRMCSIRPSHPNRQFPMASANIRAFAKSLRFIMRESHDQVSQQSKQDDIFFLCFIHGHSLSMLRQLLPCFTIHCFKQCHFTGFIYIYGCGVPTVLVVLPIIPLIHLLLSINPFSHYPMLNIQQGVRKSITRWMHCHLSHLQQTGWTIIQQREKVNN